MDCLFCWFDGKKALALGAVPCEFRVMRLLVMIFLLGMQFLSHGKTVELGFPGLQHRVKVVLPDGHDPAKKYPAILYFHGTNGKPDTHLIESHINGQKWIIVGMTYYQLGKFTLTPETTEKEMALLRSVRRHLEAKYGMDPRRCYVSGFSKGGWMVDRLLQLDHSLAGGAILGAGHWHKMRKKPLKYRGNKPVFIGIGRLDGNYPFALQALIHHRKMGAWTNIDVWPELGHAFPRGGSEAFRQWLALMALHKIENKEVIKKETEALIDHVKNLPASSRWDELRRIRELPYTKVLGKGMKDRLAAMIAELETGEKIKTEAKVLALHRKLLFREVSEKSLESLKRVNSEYQKLAKAFPGTRQSKIALLDFQRTTKLIKHFKEQEKIARENDKDPFNPVEPKQPENKRRIPMNPLVR